MDLTNFNFAYNAYQLTDAIDVLPNLYGKINASGLFATQGVSSRTVRIDRRERQIRVLALAELDAKPTVGMGSTQDAVFLEIPHIPHREDIKPQDIQDWLAFASNPMRPKTLEESVAERLQDIRDRYGITWEWMKLGALKGLITDGNGSTVYNLYEVFDIAQKIVDFALDVDTTDVRAKTYEVARYMEENAKGEIVTGVHAEVSPEFFDALTSHPNVEKFYVNWANAAQLAGGDIRKSFAFGAMVFSEYTGSLPMTDGTSSRLIEAGSGHAWPTGTRNVFKHYAGPANRLSIANMPGPDIYVSPKVLDHDKGMEFDCEGNPLPICTRPDLLVKITLT